jgi:hypothetical protein
MLSNDDFIACVVLAYEPKQRAPNCKLHDPRAINFQGPSFTGVKVRLQLVYSACETLIHDAGFWAVFHSP